MPELPEVENVRRSLAARLTGRRVVAVRVGRADIITGSATPAALLAGDRIARWERRGKQLAFIGATGRVVSVHLGMTGQLRALAQDDPRLADPHTHLLWRLDDGSRLTFRDLRRFGGIWTFPDEPTLLDQRWATLGEDALTIRPASLAAAMLGKRQALKAVLLDQTILAGLGNIYVDELLFACGLHPACPAGSLDPAQVRRLVLAMRRLLDRAIRAGGSTLRDYVNGDGEAGGFQLRHRVYGRAGQPCRTCHTLVERMVLAGRTTAFCPRCQPHPGLGASYG